MRSDCYWSANRRPRRNARRGRASPAKISSCVLIFQAQVAAPAEPERRLDFAFGLRLVFLGRRSSRSELGQLNSRKHISPTPSLPPSPPLRPRPPLRRTTLVPRSHSPYLVHTHLLVSQSSISLSNPRSPARDMEISRSGIELRHRARRACTSDRGRAPRSQSRLGPPTGPERGRST
jgi:hypothetical protein